MVVLPVRRVKVDVYDGEGNRMTVCFEGQVTRDKVLQLLDLVELLGGVPTSGARNERNLSDLSKFEKTQLIIEKRFPVGWFSSQEVQAVYEDALNEPIGLSTVSTYLARLTDRGTLTRAGSTAMRRYKLKRGLTVREKQR